MRETELAKLTSSTGSEAADLEEPPPGFEAALEARLNALEAPSSFHQATLYYALVADAPSGRLKGALLAGSFAIVLLQALVAGGVMWNVFFASCAVSGGRGRAAVRADG